MKLNHSKAPVWLDLVEGVKVQVRPCSTPIYEAGRAKMSRLVAKFVADQEEARQAGVPLVGDFDLSDEDQRTGFGQYLFVTALAQAAILDWSGVDDDPPVNEQNIADLMRHPGIAETFIVKYTAPLAALATEGN